MLATDAPVREIFRTFGAFRYLRSTGPRTSATVARVGAVASVLFLLFLILGAWRDGALILPGRSVGLFEHPGIFIFLAAQIIVPLALLRALHAFLRLPASPSIISERFLRDEFPEHERGLARTLERRNNRGRVLYSLLLSIGMIAFVWNTLQNQAPIRFLGFEFWDSASHPFGYAVTRLLKFYIWVLLFPACMHIQISLVLAVRRLITGVAATNSLELEPFHPDGCGGAKALLDAVVTPLVPVALVATLLSFAAVFVHGKLDVTTVGGLVMTCGLLLLLYLFPATALRRTIRTEKQRRLREISRAQNTHYKRVLAGQANLTLEREELAIIGAFNELCARIRGLPEWPQFDRVARLVGAAAGSPLLGWAGKHAAARLVAVLDLIRS